VENLTRKERKEIRREEAIARATSRESFLNKEGRTGYIQLLQHLNTKFPSGAVKEKKKLNKIINSIKD
jgi:hypothetical protein